MKKILKAFLTSCAALTTMGALHAQDVRSPEVASKQDKKKKQHMIILVGDQLQGDTTVRKNWREFMRRMDVHTRNMGIDVIQIGDIDKTLKGYGPKLDSALSVMDTTDNQYLLYAMFHGSVIDSTKGHFVHLGYETNAKGQNIAIHKATDAVLKPYFQHSVDTQKPAAHILASCSSDAFAKQLKQMNDAWIKEGKKGLPVGTQIVVCSQAGDVSAASADDMTGLKIGRRNVDITDLENYHLAYNSSLRQPPDMLIHSGTSRIVFEEDGINVYSPRHSLYSRLGAGLSQDDIQKIYKNKYGEGEQDRFGVFTTPQAFANSMKVLDRDLKQYNAMVDMPLEKQGQALLDLAYLFESVPIDVFIERSEHEYKINLEQQAKFKAQHNKP